MQPFVLKRLLLPLALAIIETTSIGCEQSRQPAPSSSSAPSSPTPSPPHLSVAEISPSDHLAKAKQNLEEAKKHLELIPSSAAEYKEATDLLLQINARRGLQGDRSGSPTKIIGQWAGVDGSSWFEFFADGTLILKDEKIDQRNSFSGSYKLLEDGRLKTEWMALGFAVAQVYDVSFARDTMTLVDSEGKVKEYQRVH